MQYQCRRFHVKILINCLFHACTIACNLVKYLDPRYIECITSKKGKVSGLNYPRNVAISSCNGTHIPVRAAAACDVNADAINSDSQPIQGLVQRRSGCLYRFHRLTVRESVFLSHLASIKTAPADRLALCQYKSAIYMYVHTADIPWQLNINTTYTQRRIESQWHHKRQLID